MVELDMVITHRNVIAIWQKIALGVDSLGDGGSSSVSMAPSGSINVDTTPTIPAASRVPILIPSTISPLSKRVWESDAFVEKEYASVRKWVASVGKTDVLLLNHSLRSSDEELFGPCPIIKGTHDTQDPTVTTSGANP